MDQMIYLAMSAASQMMNGQAAAAHNLANASTTGFKADFEAYRSMPLFGDGQPTRVFAMQERPGVDFSTGSIQTTGNPLDVAIAGEGFIAVQAPDGTTAYTRAGDLKLDANGVLTTGAGYPVLGNSGPIALPPSQRIQIGADGTISSLGNGQQPNTVAQADRIRLVRPALSTLIKGGDGLFRNSDGTTAEPDASVKITSGALEGSNVNPISEMIQMIETSRRYDLAVKAMHTAEQNDAAGSGVVKLN